MKKEYDVQYVDGADCWDCCYDNDEAMCGKMRRIHKDKCRSGSYERTKVQQKKEENKEMEKRYEYTFQAYTVGGVDFRRIAEESNLGRQRPMLVVDLGGHEPRYVALVSSSVYDKAITLKDRMVNRDGTWEVTAAFENLRETLGPIGDPRIPGWKPVLLTGGEIGYLITEVKRIVKGQTVKPKQTVTVKEVQI